MAFGLEIYDAGGSLVLSSDQIAGHIVDSVTVGYGNGSQSNVLYEGCYTVVQPIDGTSYPTYWVFNTTVTAYISGTTLYWNLPAAAYGSTGGIPLTPCGARIFVMRVV